MLEVKFGAKFSESENRNQVNEVESSGQQDT